MYTIDSWLNEAKNKLAKSGIESAHLDSVLLLEYVLHKRREHLLAHPEITLDKASIQSLTSLLVKRCNRIPLPYITNSIEFYGNQFWVNEHVLIPRPETENFINLLLLKQKQIGSIIDVGTGSGILGITAKLLIPGVEVTCTDINAKALMIAKQNAATHKVSIIFKHQSLLDDNNYNAILANLPYVPESIPLANELSYEPTVALHAAEGGMIYYRQLWDRILSNRNKPYFVLTESLLDQHHTMLGLANKSGYKIESNEGLVQLFVRHSL